MKMWKENAPKIDQRKIDPERVKNLVFEGGGGLGICYSGAMQALQQAKIELKNIVRVGGTSAGAIIALMISIGFTSKEMEKRMKVLDFKKFLDDSTFKTSNTLLKVNDSSALMKIKKVKPIVPIVAYRVSKYYGIYKGEYFRKFIEKVIIEHTKEHTKEKNLTFKELHELRETDPKYKDLYVVGVNLNTSMEEVFSWETTPNVIIADAIRISMSIPYIFQPHALYRKNKSGEIEADSKKHIYVDGGVINNYPIKLFDNTKYIAELSAQENKPIFNKETLGFKLSKKTQKDFLESEKEAPEVEIDGIITLTKALFGTILKKQENDHAKSNDKCRTIYIDTLGENPLNFDLTMLQKNKLIRSGIKAVCESFNIPLSKMPVVKEEKEAENIDKGTKDSVPEVKKVNCAIL